MNIFGFAVGCTNSPPSRPRLASLLALTLLLPVGGSMAQQLWAAQPEPAQVATAPLPPYNFRNVRPAAAGGGAPGAVSGFPGGAGPGGIHFPEQVVEADRSVQANPDLKGDALAHAVDPQPWDPSVKALTAFPSVLGNMDKNLSWTSSLGDAYYNQPQDVMDAVQVMRLPGKPGRQSTRPPRSRRGGEPGPLDQSTIEPEKPVIPSTSPLMTRGRTTEIP